jgi:hypothetical protein
MSEYQEVQEVVDANPSISSHEYAIVSPSVSQSDKALHTDSLTHSDKWLQTSPLLKNERIGISLDKNVVFGVSGVFEHITLKAIADSKSAACFTCFLWVVESETPPCSKDGKEIPLGVCILCASENILRTVRFHGTNSFNVHLTSKHGATWSKVLALVETEKSKKVETKVSRCKRSAGNISGAGVADKQEFFVAAPLKGKGLNKELTHVELHRELGRQLPKISKLY